MSDVYLGEDHYKNIAITEINEAINFCMIVRFQKMNIVFKSGDYVSVPMTENLFWNRVGNLRNAMLTAENFEFRLLYFHKLQELMRFVP